MVTRRLCSGAHRWRQKLASLCVCVALTSGAQAAESVQALRYGTTLFHFFQADYFNALTELMAGQQLQQLDVHAANAELLRGGMSLSYGLDRQAEQVFQSLLNDSGEFTDLAERDRAWFYLAKTAWQRGEQGRSRSILAKMSEHYQGPLAPQADYMRASAALAEGDETQARQFLERLPADSPWRYYLYYNLGAHQAAAGHWDTAVDDFKYFDQLGVAPEEIHSLRDKALTASGFALLAAGQYEQAQVEFTRVRLNSPMADRALLGYGLAASEQQDYRLALSSWHTLSEREVMSSSARESLLAIPYAYEQLGRPAIALQNYQAAADVYLAQLASVREAILAFQQDDLVELLALGATETESHAWLFGENLLPVEPQTTHLHHLISQHSFQLAMRELRDLHRLVWHVADAHERLQVLAQVDADQRQSWSSVIEDDRRVQLQQRQQILQQEAQRLAERLSAAMHEPDGGARAVADTAQTARWQRLERAEARVKRLSRNSSSQAESAQRLALVRGLMVWRDSEQYPALAFALKRELQSLESAMQQSTELLQDVDEVLATRQQAAFASRITAMEQRFEPHQLRLQVAIDRSESQLRQVAVTELELQADHLTRALGQSRLAIARLYDQSSSAVPR